jgi:hypothetical protein
MTLRHIWAYIIYEYQYLRAKRKVRNDIEQGVNRAVIPQLFIGSFKTNICMVD